MRPFVAESVADEDWKLFCKIRRVIDQLPSRMVGDAFFLGVPLSRDIAETRFIPDCHAFTRALARFFPVDVHDGVVSELLPDWKPSFHYHSWLTRSGGNGKIIIDPWPLGSVSGPALFVQDYAFHFGNECSLLHTRTQEFQSHLKVLIEATRLVLGEEVETA